MFRVLTSFLLSTLLLLGAASCTQKRDAQSPSKSIPLAGQSQLPQVYFLLDAAAGSLRQKRWGEFEPSSLSTEIPARVEFKMVHSLEEAKEVLQVINGRQIDELFLGLGSPQKAWTELSMPRVEKRRVYAFAPESKNSNWVSLLPDYKELSKFLLRLCSEEFLEASCVIEPSEFLQIPHKKKQKQEGTKSSAVPVVVHLGASEQQSIQGALPVSVNIWIDWSEFLRMFILGQHPSNEMRSDSYVIGFSSSALKISKGVAIQNDISKTKKFDEFLKLFNLEILGMGRKGNVANDQLPSAEVLKHPDSSQQTNDKPNEKNQ